MNQMESLHDNAEQREKKKWGRMLLSFGLFIVVILIIADTIIPKEQKASTKKKTTVMFQTPKSIAIGKAFKIMQQSRSKNMDTVQVRN
jgi:hypothetical protein